MLPKGELEDFLSNSINKDEHKTLSHDFGNLTFYVTVHDTVSSNSASWIGSPEKVS